MVVGAEGMCMWPGVHVCGGCGASGLWQALGIGRWDRGIQTDAIDAHAEVRYSGSVIAFIMFITNFRYVRMRMRILLRVTFQKHLLYN